MNAGQITSLIKYILMDYLDTESLKEVSSAAQYLLGSHIIRSLDDGSKLVAKIVETEAYHQSDPASHTYRGKTKRNFAMFGPAAHAYIYFTYGMHWCFNITTGVENEGSGVLIRAVEPILGTNKMKILRGWSQPPNKPIYNLTNGPAKLTQALSIDKSLYGHNLKLPPLQVIKQSDTPPEPVTQTTRIGIKNGTDTPWRFYLTNNPFVSRKAPL